jgi:hypothetical protein
MLPPVRRYRELGEPKEVSGQRMCSIILPLIARQTESAPKNYLTMFIKEGVCEHGVSTHSVLCSWTGRLITQSIKGVY